MRLFNSSYEKTFGKIHEVLTRHKNKINELESKIAYLESRLVALENENNPWKMPFD